MGLVKLTIMAKILFLARVIFGVGGFFGSGGGCLSLFQVHLLILLGPRVVFIARAFTTPIWTLEVEPPLIVDGLDKLRNSHPFHEARMNPTSRSMQSTLSTSRQLACRHVGMGPDLRRWLASVCPIGIPGL